MPFLLRTAALALIAAAAASAPARAQDESPCVRTDTLPARVAGDTVIGESYEDLRRGAVFRCTLRRGAPPIRVVVRADQHGVPVRAEVFDPAAAARPRQVLALPVNEPPRRYSEFLGAVDLNADGWMDLMLMSWWGATGNTGYEVFIYDPAARRFTRSQVLSAQSNPEPIGGRPCVRTHSVGGMAGMIRDEDEFCWRGRAWVHVRSESQVWDRERSTDSIYVFRRTIRERRNGRLRTVRVQTVREPMR
jgi:hypothetical protein